MDERKELSNEEQILQAYNSLKLMASIGLTREDAAVYHNCIFLLDKFVLEKLKK